MAVTATGRQLTEIHRLAQLRLGIQSITAVTSAWPLLDPTDLDTTIGRWLNVVLPIVQGQRAASSSLASGYLTAFRALELGTTEPFIPTLAPTADAGALITSLTVTGPVAIKSAVARGVPFVRAVATAERTSAAAAMRHALAGGRDTITHTITKDRRALGYARVASGKACAFCAMLASRGPVYKSESVDFHAHDGCSCTSEPVYHSHAGWPAGSTRYRDLWEESTRGLKGDEAVNAFRRALAAA